MSQYVLSIDQGTTSSRGLLFDENGKHVATVQEEFKQYFPNDGWVEHDANEIWLTTLNVCREVLQNVNLDEVKAIGITNQRETTVVWDRETGEPIHPAIVWQDRRTAQFCKELKAKGCEETINAKTGLLIDPYFSASKIRWILNEVPGARARAEAGELAFGTIDTFLLWRLTEGKSHFTDATNASRTSLFNIHTQQWDEELLSLFEIPAALLPEVKDSSDDFGESATHWFEHAYPVCSMIGDQQSALVGQACFKPGMVKSTYGTGCFMVLNTGSEVIKSKSRLLSTVAYRINGVPTYALEGSIFVAGAAIQWLRDGLQLIAHAKDSEQLAEQVGYENPVYLVPAFTGLGAPYWDPNARGALFGLTRDTGIAEIVTAGLQAVCYQTRDLLSAMEQDGASVKSLRVDGGMVVNDWVTQFLADILQVYVERPAIVETTALGAAYLAGLRIGMYENLDQIESLWALDARFEPRLDESSVEALYGGWLAAIERVKSQGSSATG